MRMIALNIFDLLVAVMAFFLFGGFLDLLWHIGRDLWRGANGITRALFLFFLSCAGAMPWVILDEWARQTGQTGEGLLHAILVVWRFLGMAGLLASLVYLRICLYRSDEQ